MSRLTLETHDNRTHYQPGETIEGIIGWERDEPPTRVEVSLLWHTAGKGDRDASVVERMSVDQPTAVDAQIFSFTAPDGPYSFEGKLLSINWSLELIVQPDNAVQRLDLAIAPGGAPVRPYVEAQQAT